MDTGSRAVDATQEAVPSSGPALEYAQRLQMRQSVATQLQRKHIWIGNLRIAAFIAILGLSWEAGKTGSHVMMGVLAVITVFFVFLVVLHRRTLRALNSAKRAAAFYERGLTRIGDRWSGAGPDGAEFRNGEHLYADDLDILGEGSLFQLLCTARTVMGKQKLAGWLLNEAGPDAIQERQAAVEELRAKLDFREALAVAGENDHIDADPEKLGSWASETISLNRSWWPIYIMLALIGLACLGYWIATANVIPFATAMMVNFAVIYSRKDRLDRFFKGLEDASAGLGSLSKIVQRIELEKPGAPLLAIIARKLQAEGPSAFEAISKLGTLCDFEESRRNMIVRALDVLVLYSVHLALLLQIWREKHGKSVSEWLTAIGEMEALCSFSAYAFEHPDDYFPEIAAAESGLCFEAEELGHPLLPKHSCVRNSVALGGKNQVLLVSGSNMSGKSTLLRAVGINAVMAMAGMPVRAARLRLSPMMIGAAMRVSDSLQKGVSHFYAEISRIRDVVALSENGPLLFLFDEILQGTNSHDRKVGAEGILTTLIHRGAIGLVTTHDLALTSVAQMFPNNVRNVHFQEKLEAGKLSFDYRLREGVVTTSNGVELMRSVGLQV